MLPLALFRSRTFSAVNLLTLLLYAALGGVFCPSSNGLGQSELFKDGGSGSFGLEFRRLSTDVAIVAV